MPRRPPPALPPFGVAAVLLHSPRPERLSAFYREALGLPLEEVDVEGYPRHFACELASVYVAILEGRRGRGAPRSCVAFHVDDVRGRTRALAKSGVRCVSPPRRTPLGLIARFADPEGNLFELYAP